MFLTKRTHQCRIFQTFESSNVGSPNSSCHFWNHKVRVYSNFSSLFNVMKDNFSVFFLAQASYTLEKKSPSKWNFQTFEWLDEISRNFWCHINMKLHFKFETTSQCFFKLGTTLKCHQRQLFCTFLAETLYDLNKKIPSKCKISDFRLLTSNFTKFILW